MKRISWILVMTISLITGTVAGLYLYRTAAASMTLQISDESVRYINESIFKMIKKDPRKYLLVHKIITSSPYLKKQKRAFLAKYYGHKSTADIRQAERLLRLYAKSQQKPYTKK